MFNLIIFIQSVISYNKSFETSQVRIWTIPRDKKRVWSDVTQLKKSYFGVKKV